MSSNNSLLVSLSVSARTATASLQLQSCFLHLVTSNTILSQAVGGGKRGPPNPILLLTVLLLRRPKGENKGHKDFKTTAKS